jgi:hypothetical protein
MSDIAQLLDVKHHYLRFNWEGKATSGPIIPTAASSWTYGALGANPLLVSFEERWQEPERLASVLNVVGAEMATIDVLEESEIYHTTLTQDDASRYYWHQHHGIYAFTISPPPTDYTNLRLELVDCSHAANGSPDAWQLGYRGMRTPPNEAQAGIDVFWTDPAPANSWVEVKLYGTGLVTHGGGQFAGTAINTNLSSLLEGAGYSGVTEYSNDYLKENAACEWLAKRLVTWLANECYPASLVVPCNLVHEPGDLITVSLDKYGGTAARAVPYIILSHKIEYERGKPNLSTLELVRDTTHMWT